MPNEVLAVTEREFLLLRNALGKSLGGSASAAPVCEQRNCDRDVLEAVCAPRLQRVQRRFGSDRDARMQGDSSILESPNLALA